ncbi:MAG TPA: MASE1 domain-containing protein [Pseudolabrys sp.]|nr:MASE1 domain-containing protein [Pseudolabrys sp.]
MDVLVPEVAIQERQKGMPHEDRGKTFRNGLIVAIAYYVGAEIAFLVGTLSDKIFAPFWPPNIVLFCALLLSFPRQWWIYILAAFPAHVAAELQVGMPIMQLLVAFATNCSVAVINAFLLQQLQFEQPWFGSIRKATTYVFIAAFVSPALCAFGGAFVQILGGGSLENYGLYWARWYASNALGSLALAPIVLICLEKLTWFSLTPALRGLEAMLIAAVLAITCIVAFKEGDTIASGYVPALLYLPLPIIVWAAVRFGATGASGVIMVISLVLIWRTLNGQNLFDVGDPEANVFAMQLFLIGLSSPILLLGAAIEETRHAETVTREREERMSVAAASSSVALWQYELATDTFWATDYCRTLFGLPSGVPSDLDRLLNRIHPNDFQTAQAAFKSAIARAVPFETEFRVQGHDEGYRWISVRAQPVIGNDGSPTAITGAFADSTSRKMAEAESDMQRQEIAHLMRVSMLGELSGGLAHELTQPLTAILSNAQAGKILLAGGKKNLAEIGNIFDDIITEDGRAGEVIHRLRGLLKKGEIKYEAVDMNELIASTLRLLHSELIDRRISINDEKNIDLPPAHGDPIQLQQVLLNLFMNAMDAMDGVPPAQRAISINTAATNEGGIEVRISDCGTGLPPAQEQSVFKPFFTTKKRGLGLGLAICASIMKLHGGSLSLQNNVSKGAMAIFRLPPPGP